jgi:hypothetical protein
MASSPPASRRSSRYRTVRRRSIVAVACLAAGLAFASLAAASGAREPPPVVLDPAAGCGPTLDTEDAEDCVPPTVAVYDGWSAWSRESQTGFELVVRSPAGVISTPAVPDRAAPFDVGLGPDGSKVVAVFSRCTNALTDEGCALYELPLGVPGAGETAIPVPASSGASLHEPAIWDGTIVFLRRDAGGNEDVYDPHGGRPDSLFVWRTATRTVKALPLPRSRGTRSSPTELGWPKGLTGVISGLTLHGSELAYTTTTGSGDFAMSTLWLEQVGQAPRLIDQVTAGAGNVCDPQFLPPVISGGWLYAYLHDCPAGGGPISDDRFTRYSIGGERAERADYNFIHYIDDQIFAVAPLGVGAIWDAGSVELLPRLDWRKIARPMPATLCSSADPFC